MITNTIDLANWDWTFKLLIDKSTVWAITTTYVCKALYSQTDAPDETSAVWQILKIVKDWTIERTFLPCNLNSGNPENSFSFIANNRTALTYK